MKTKHFNVTIFEKNDMHFECYTTNTRNGFCHTCKVRNSNITDTKASYLNRTWERYDYQGVLTLAAHKYDKTGARAREIHGTGSGYWDNITYLGTV